MKRYDLIVIEQDQPDCPQQPKQQNMDCILWYLMKMKNRADSYLSRFISSLAQRSTKAKIRGFKIGERTSR